MFLLALAIMVAMALPTFAADYNNSLAGYNRLKISVFADWILQGSANVQYVLPQNLLTAFWLKRGQ